jgi:hypothetical protein
MSQQNRICHIKLDDLKTITKIPLSDSRNVMRCLVDIFGKYQQQCNKKNRISQSQTFSMTIFDQTENWIPWNNGILCIKSGEQHNIAIHSQK